MATRSVSRTPSPLVSAKCLRSNMPLLMMLLLPPVNCTKPVMVPLLMMPVVLGSPATARSDNAPMLPSLVRVAVPPVELRITPAAGRPKSVEPTPVRSACQPPITDTPGATLTVTLPRGPPVALIPVLNCPVVETLCRIDLHRAGRRGGPDAMRFSALRRDRPVRPTAAVNVIVYVPLSATMPSASAPFVVIGPEEVTR